MSDYVDVYASHRCDYCGSMIQKEKARVTYETHPNLYYHRQCWRKVNAMERGYDCDDVMESGRVVSGSFEQGKKK